MVQPPVFFAIAEAHRIREGLAWFALRDRGVLVAFTKSCVLVSLLLRNRDQGVAFAKKMGLAVNKILTSVFQTETSSLSHSKCVLELVLVGFLSH